MCIIFVKTDPNPSPNGFRLILASNRDEFFKRPAKDAFLDAETQVIGGRDMYDGREGGMWLGLSLKNKKQLTIAALLNVTGEDQQTNVKSRGFIVADYLKSNETTTEYFNNLISKGKYNAFNLVTVEMNDNKISTNFCSNTPIHTCQFFGEQTVSFGNSPVNRPLTKVRNGRDIFSEIVSGSKTKDALVEDLMKLLRRKGENLPDPELQRRAPQSYVDLSSIFVEIEKIYGTRTHTVILVDYDWNVEFYERTMEPTVKEMNPLWKYTQINAKL